MKKQNIKKGQSMIDATVLAFGDETKIFKHHLNNNLTELPCNLKGNEVLNYKSPLDEKSKINLKVLNKQVNILATKTE